MTLSRRRLLAFGLLPLACDSARPQKGFLGLTERLNDRVQRALFRPAKLAAEEPERSAIGREFRCGRHRPDRRDLRDGRGDPG